MGFEQVFVHFRIPGGVFALRGNWTSGAKAFFTFLWGLFWGKAVLKIKRQHGSKWRKGFVLVLLRVFIIIFIIFRSIAQNGWPSRRPKLLKSFWDTRDRGAWRWDRKKPWDASSLTQQRTIKTYKNIATERSLLVAYFETFQMMPCHILSLHSFTRKCSFQEYHGCARWCRPIKRCTSHGTFLKSQKQHFPRSAVQR